MFSDFCAAPIYRQDTVKNPLALLLTTISAAFFHFRVKPIDFGMAGGGNARCRPGSGMSFLCINNVEQKQKRLRQNGKK